MSGFPDLPTVFLVCCLLSLVLAMALLMVHRTSPTYPGFRQWVVAAFSVLFSCTLLSVIQLLPARPATLVVNLTFFAYPVLLARGLRRFLALPARDWIGHATFALVTVIAVLLLYVWPNANLRVFLLSLLLVPLFGDCGMLARRLRSSAHPAVKASLIGAFSVLAAWNLLRVPLTLFMQDGNAQAPAPPVIAAVTMILLTAANLGVSLCVILLNYARAAESLRESEERFRNLASAAFEGILISEQGVIVEANEQAQHLLGCSRTELIGRGVSSLTKPGQEPLLPASADSAFAPRELLLLRRGGIDLPVEAQTKLMQLNARPVHITALRDLTERHIMQQALEDSEERFQSAMYHAPIGMAIVALDGRWLEVNPALCRITGYSRTELLARSFQSITHPDDRLSDSQYIDRLLAGSLTSYNREKRYLHKSGRTVWIQVHVSAVAGPNGKPRHLVSQILDVTEQREAARQQQHLEEQLRHAQKMDALGTLAGGIAHDFNNILTGIMGNLQLAGLDLPPDHPAQARLKDAGRASERARDHIARILAFSRHHQGERLPTSLAPVVNEVSQLLRTSLPSSIDIRVTTEPHCPAVVCDPAQMHQVLMNLGTNAAHAMQGAGGRLEIELRSVRPDRDLRERFPQVRPEHRVCLSVRDTGSGIDPAIMSRIFEPFFTTKTSREGTGLGLAMVHGIVEDHGGAITVLSRPGEGSDFSLYFPAAVQAAEPAPSSPDQPVRPRAFGGGRKVMVVDDDPSVLRLGESVLRLAGFQCEGFSRPTQALARFSEAAGEFVAVVSDLTMPEMNGTDLARHMRELRPDVPFILISGYLHADASARAHEAGIDRFIRKPFSVEEFTDELRRALDGGPTASS